MIQFETTKAKILFVEVPSDITWVKITSSGNIVCKVDKTFSVQTLPEGTWQFITLLKDAREDQAKTMMYQNNLLGYRNFVIESSPILLFDNAIESLHSLANSLGVKGNAAVLVKVSV